MDEGAGTNMAKEPFDVVCESASLTHSSFGSAPLQYSDLLLRVPLCIFSKLSHMNTPSAYSCLFLRCRGGFGFGCERHRPTLTPIAHKNIGQDDWYDAVMDTVDFPSEPASYRFTWGLYVRQQTAEGAAAQPQPARQTKGVRSLR